jgi:hypothetical protein
VSRKYRFRRRRNRPFFKREANVEFCARCHLHIPLKSPDRTMSEGVVYHFSCYKAMLKQLIRQAVRR